jgi:hypothetical protein
MSLVRQTTDDGRWTGVIVRRPNRHTPDRCYIIPLERLFPFRVDYPAAPNMSDSAVPQSLAAEPGLSQAGHAIVRAGLRAAVLLWPVAAYAALALVMTYPLALDLGGSVVYGVTADADVSRWDLWWFKTAVLERHTNPFYTDMLYYPYRQGANALPLYYHTLQPLNSFLAIPVLLLTDPVVGPTLAYNLLMLAHFVFAGCAMLWLLRYLTGSTAAGFVAGAIFTFGPFHQYHFHYGQLELVPIAWLPLYLLFLFKMLRSLRDDRKSLVTFGALAAGCLIATSLTSWYLNLYLLITGGLAVLFHIWQQPREWKRSVLALAAVLATWAILVAPLLWVTVRASLDPTFSLVSGLDYEVRLSLSPFDLVTVYKDLRINPPVWLIGPLGYTSILLGAIGAWRLGHKGALWYALVGVGVVMALGPYLKLDDAYDVQHSTGIPLPYLLLRELPFLSIARVPRRFVLLANLGLCVLAGYAVAQILSWAAQQKDRLHLRVSSQLLTRATLLVLVALPMLEFATLPQPAHKVFISPFFSRVAHEPGDFGILELPVTTHYLRDHQRMLHQTVHGKKIIGGYVSRRVYDYYLDRANPFNQFLELTDRPEKDIVPLPSPFAALNFYNIPYIVAYKQDESYERPSDRKEIEDYLRLIFPDRSAVVQDDEQLTAYRVPAVDLTAPLIWPGNGWYPPETEGDKTWRWGVDQAGLMVFNRTHLSRDLTFASATLRGAAHLDVLVDGTLLKRFDLTPTLEVLSAGRLELPPGEHQITFRTDATPITPVEAGISERDARKLGFVISDLHFD